MSSLDTETVEADGDGSIYRKSLIVWARLDAGTVERYRTGVRRLAEEHSRAYLEGAKAAG